MVVVAGCGGGGKDIVEKKKVLSTIQDIGRNLVTW